MDLELRNCEAARDQSLKVEAQNTYLRNINQQLMRIVGIDPGIRVTGFGVIEKNKKLSVLSYGTISPPTQNSMAERLKYLYTDAMEIIEKYKPDLLAIESTFHQKNVKSALILGQAKGSIPAIAQIPA